MELLVQFGVTSIYCLFIPIIICTARAQIKIVRISISQLKSKLKVDGKIYVSQKHTRAFSVLSVIMPFLVKK